MKMADAYGTLVFSKSSDGVVDANRLALALNEARWDTDGGELELTTSQQLLFYSNPRPQYPSLIPERDHICHCFDTARQEAYSKPPADMTDEDWDNFQDSDYHACPLDELRDMAAPFITSGWIEIAYSSNEKQRYVEFGRLKIYADGRAERSLIQAGPHCTPVQSYEEIR